MNRRLVNVFAVLSLAAANVFGGSNELVFEGILPVYESVTEVQLILRNVGDAALYLDSFQADMIVVERRADDDSKWETGYNWRCGNAGAGTPRKIKVGRILEAKLTKSWAFRMDDEPPQFEMEDGRKQRIPGHYRVVVRYSRKEWSDLAHIPNPSEVVTAVSREFEIRQDR